MTKKRNSQTYPGLDKSKNLKIRQEVMDQDYIDKLTDEEKDWLDRFNREFNGAEFDHGGEVLHKTRKLKRSCEKRNNDRNNCEYGVAKARKRIDELDSPAGEGTGAEVSTTDLGQNEVVMLNMIALKQYNDRELEYFAKRKRKKRKKKKKSKPSSIPQV